MNTFRAVETFKYIEEQPEIIKVISFQQIFMSLPLPRGDRRLLSSCIKGCNGEAARKVLNLFLFKCMDIFSVTAPTVFIPSLKASLTHTPARRHSFQTHTIAKRWKNVPTAGREARGGNMCIMREREGRGGAGRDEKQRGEGGGGEKKKRGERGEEEKHRGERERRGRESVNSKCVRSNKFVVCSNSFWTCCRYSF